jgi:pimeloyl-ACP methyl ester carboxylesterase
VTESVVARRVTLHHNKVELALHHLREADGRALLVLHGLGEHSPAEVPALIAPWSGPVWALDFTGHGASTVPRGGGYTAESLMGDADAALAHLGEATVYGRGLGAYIALLLAGARPTIVSGAVLDDGPGLVGGGAAPASPVLLRLADDLPAPPDPFALAELSHDVRPPDYAATFVRQAVHFGSLDPCISVAARVKPPWLAEVVDEYGVVEESVPEALARYG